VIAILGGEFNRLIKNQIIAIFLIWLWSDEFFWLIPIKKKSNIWSKKHNRLQSDCLLRALYLHDIIVVFVLESLIFSYDRTEFWSKGLEQTYDFKMFDIFIWICIYKCGDDKSCKVLGISGSRVYCINHNKTISTFNELPWHKCEFFLLKFDLSGTNDLWETFSLLQWFAT